MIVAQTHCSKGTASKQSHREIRTLQRLEHLQDAPKHTEALSFPEERREALEKLGTIAGSWS